MALIVIIRRMGSEEPSIASERFDRFTKAQCQCLSHMYRKAAITTHEDEYADILKYVEDVKHWLSPQWTWAGNWKFEIKEVN
jgi:hypothetical protein